MTKITITGVNALGEPVKLAADIHRFTDDKNRVSVYILNDYTIKLVTAKGSYQIQRHPSLNIYAGEFNGHKVHISLKKIVGHVIYW